MGLSSFNPKGFYHSYAWHDLAVYVKEGLQFAWDLSLENSPDSYLCFRLILSNIEEVLSINPSANVFAFGDFNAHHKDWLTYLCDHLRDVRWEDIFKLNASAAARGFC